MKTFDIKRPLLEARKTEQRYMKIAFFLLTFLLLAALIQK